MGISLTAGLLAALAAMPADSGRTTADRIRLEAGLGAAVGEARMAASGAQFHPGLAWRVGAALALLPRLELYAGYGRSGFGCADGFCAGNHVRFAAGGFDAGARLTAGRFHAGLGVVHHALRSEWVNAEGPGSRRSPASTGWEVGAGVEIDVAPRIALVPALRYSTFEAAAAGSESAGRVGVLGAAVGIRIRPGG
jgi:opacity protein-like surface antigen